MPEDHDELMSFWAACREPMKTDPLQFWLGVSISQPGSRIAQMAIDYLSAPAASADAERAFSRGALTVTHRRHALSDVSTRNSIVLGGWLGTTNPVIVPKDGLIQFFQDKPLRKHPISCGASAEADVSMDSASDMTP
jgi:hAT family C-terminal dimerisation region